MMELKHWEQTVRIHTAALEIFLKNRLKKSYAVTLQDAQTGKSKVARQQIEKAGAGIRLIEKKSGAELFLACNPAWIKNIADQFSNDETDKEEKSEALVVDLFSEFIEIACRALEEEGMEIDVADINKINKDELSDLFNFDEYFISTIAAESSLKKNDKENLPSLNMFVVLSSPDKEQIDAFNDKYEDENPFSNERYAKLINDLAGNAGRVQRRNSNTDYDASMSMKGQEVEFEDFGRSKAPENIQPPRNIDLLKDVEMQVSVELGSRKMPLGNILQLVKGSVIELEKLAGEPVEVLVNGHKIAQGDVVVVDEHFGVRISNLLATHERIKELQ